MKELPLSRSRKRSNQCTQWLPSKLKIVCSFNGAFKPRPPAGNIRYVGGDSRILSVDRDIGYFGLRSSISNAFQIFSPFSIKYRLHVSRLAHGDRDIEPSVVPIVSDEDVRCMIEEYEKTEMQGNVRIWIFVCHSDNEFGDYCGGVVSPSNRLHKSRVECSNLGPKARVRCDGPMIDGKKLNETQNQLFKTCCGSQAVKKSGVDGGHSKRYGDDSIKTMVSSGFEISNTDLFYQTEANNYDHPLIDLGSELHSSLPKDSARGVKVLDSAEISHACMHGSANNDKLCPGNGKSLHPLNPRDGNLHVKTKNVQHCLVGQSGCIPHNGARFPRDSGGLFGESKPCNLLAMNRENIVPLAGTCDSMKTPIPSISSSTQLNVSSYPTQSLNTSESVSNLCQNSINAMKQNVNPKQTCKYLDNAAGVANHGIPRSEGRSSRGKLCGGRPVSNIAKHELPKTVYHPYSRELSDALPYDAQERTMGEMDAYANTDNCSSYIPCGSQQVNDQHVSSFTKCGTVITSSPNELTNQQDLLTGSICDTHEFRIQMDIMRVQPVSQARPSDKWLHENAAVLSTCLIDLEDNCFKAEPEVNALANQTKPHNKQEGFSSSEDLLNNLSLSSSTADFSQGLLRSQPNCLDPKDEVQLSSPCPENESSEATTKSSLAKPLEVLSGEKASEQELMLDVGIDEKDDTEKKLGSSEVIDKVSNALSAVYISTATGKLQTINNSDVEYIKELGSGTFGTVFYGKWKGSDVAIKNLKPSCFSHGTAKENRLVADFWKEAYILGQLRHPNIVAFYGVVTDGPVTNLATITEYMVNGSLKQVMQRKDGIIDRRKRLIIAMDAAFGMEYLHGKNIVHFDLKSHNFLVDMKDRHRPICKIGDLGLSKIKKRTLISGGVRGTIPWMAPELLNCTNNLVTDKVDVYSFGIVMWELLTGDEPYKNLPSREIIGGIMKGDLRPEIPTWCDPGWRSLMERCWASDPTSRPAFSDIAKELRAMAATLNIR